MALRMRTLRLVLGYDGTDFAGWQFQPGHRTVQGVIGEAFGRLGDKGPLSRGSGRTDRGVHARGQVASVRTTLDMPADRLLMALRAHLPSDVDLHRIDEMPECFDALRHAVRKTYRYSIVHGGCVDVFTRRFHWQVPHVLRGDIMRTALDPILGTHDFRAFETRWPNRQSSIRTIHRLDWRENGPSIQFDIEANGFLYNMVRAIAGTLVDIGRGFRPAESLEYALKQGVRSLAGPTAPPCGLCLMSVVYPPPYEFVS